MNIRTIGVIGAGTMGTGIAQACALSGLKVVLRDIDIKYVEASVNRIAASLGRSVEKGKISEDDKNNALKRIQKTTILEDLTDVDIVIEAVIEDLALKKEIFSELNNICGENTVFATNTSSISVTDIANSSGRAERFCGIHFFNPVSVMKLVEIISGLNTAEATVETAYGLAKLLDKIPVHVKKDSPGFIVNKLLVPYLNEAAKLLSEGVASAEDIDLAIKYGLNYPMGPFEMLDMGGIDLTVTILDYFTKEYGNLHYAPQLILRQMLRAGRTGKKRGEGFYCYR